MRLPGPLLPDQEKHLRTVQSSGRHLLSLINDLLDLAKIESGKVEIHRERVACQGVVEEVNARCGPAAESKGLAFGSTISRPDPQVLADRRALESDSAPTSPATRSNLPTREPYGFRSARIPLCAWPKSAFRIREWVYAWKTRRSYSRRSRK